MLRQDEGEIERDVTAAGAVAYAVRQSEAAQQAAETARIARIQDAASSSRGASAVTVTAASTTDPGLPGQLLDPTVEAGLVAADQQGVVAPTRVDVNIPGARAFRVRSLISGDEAKALASVATAIGMKPVDWEYDPSYRSCTRCVLSAPTLASRLWARLSPLLCATDLAVRPFGFGNRGTWRPVGLTDCLRISRSEAGDRFAKHRDGSFVLDDEHRTVYTVLIYLAVRDDGAGEPLLGGETVLYDGVDGSQPALKVIPAVGEALIFNHDLLHEGRPVERGTKTLLRADILFRRVDEGGGARLSAELAADPQFVEADRLYNLSIAQQKAGDPAGSTTAYLKALELQAELRSVAEPAAENVSHDDDSLWALLSEQEWLQILGELPIADVVAASAVSKDFRLFATSSFIWARLYAQHWQTELPPTMLQQLTTSYWHAYRDRTSAEREHRVLVLACTRTLFSDDGLAGACKLAFGRLDALSMVSEEVKGRTSINARHRRGHRREAAITTQSGGRGCVSADITRASGHYWSAESGFQQYYVGKEMEGFGGHWGDLQTRTALGDVRWDGTVFQAQVDIECFRVLTEWVMRYGFARNTPEPLQPAATPLLIALPPPLAAAAAAATSFRQKLGKMLLGDRERSGKRREDFAIWRDGQMMPDLGAASLMFADTAALALLARGITTGVVIDLSLGCWVVPILAGAAHLHMSTPLELCHSGLLSSLPAAVLAAVEYLQDQHDPTAERGARNPPVSVIVTRTGSSTISGELTTSGEVTTDSMCGDIHAALAAATVHNGVLGFPVRIDLLPVWPAETDEIVVGGELFAAMPENHIFFEVQSSVAAEMNHASEPDEKHRMLPVETKIYIRKRVRHSMWAQSDHAEDDY